MKPSHTFRAVFDDPNLVSSAGLVPVLQLAKSAGWYELLEGLSVPSPRAAVKVSSVVGGMLAGAASIDDLDLLRHGAMGRLFDDVRAPSTLGTFLRSFSHGHVQQLDRVVPPESWRASLCGFPVGSRGVLVADRAHHACGAVPTLVVVEPVAPVKHDGLGLAGVVELVA